MHKNILGDLKSTFAGVGAAVLQVLANGRSWQSIALAVFTAALGAFSTFSNQNSQK